MNGGGGLVIGGSLVRDCSAEEFFFEQIVRPRDSAPAPRFSWAVFHGRFLFSHNIVSFLLIFSSFFLLLQSCPCVATEKHLMTTVH